MVKQFDNETSLRLDYALMMSEREGDSFRQRAGKTFKSRIERSIFELEMTIEKAERALVGLRGENDE